jgi:hypothetical protein
MIAATDTKNTSCQQLFILPPQGPW